MWSRVFEGRRAAAVKTPALKRLTLRPTRRVKTNMSCPCVKHAVALIKNTFRRRRCPDLLFYKLSSGETRKRQI